MKTCTNSKSWNPELKQKALIYSPLLASHPKNHPKAEDPSEPTQQLLPQYLFVDSNRDLAGFCQAD